MPGRIVFRQAETRNAVGLSVNVRDYVEAFDGSTVDESAQMSSEQSALAAPNFIDITLHDQNEWQFRELTSSRKTPLFRRQ